MDILIIPVATIIQIVNESKGFFNSYPLTPPVAVPVSMRGGDRPHKYETEPRKGECVMSDKKIKSMVMAAVMAALTYVATTVIKIPAPTGGYVHIGDGLVLLLSLIHI